MHSFASSGPSCPSFLSCYSNWNLNFGNVESTEKKSISCYTVSLTSAFIRFLRPRNRQIVGGTEEPPLTGGIATNITAITLSLHELFVVTVLLLYNSL